MTALAIIVVTLALSLATGVALARMDEARP